MKARIFPATVLLFLTLGLNQCATAHSSSSPAVDSQAARSGPITQWQSEEYEVYSAYIDQSFLLDDNSVIPIFDFTIKQEGPVPQARNYIKKNLSAVKDDTLDDFFRKNGKVFVLQRRLQIPARYYFVVQDGVKEEKAAAAEKRDPALVSRYIHEPDEDVPQATTAFSRVGFNSHRDQAFFLVERAGIRKYTLFAKMEGRWLYQGCFRTPPETN